MKYNSWTEQKNNPKFWKIFANIITKSCNDNLLKINQNNMKSVKIDIPKGYEIDKEKSTFENIVLKKVDGVVIKWNISYRSVEIKANGEHFLLGAYSPSIVGDWIDAERYIAESCCCWCLPTKKQLKVVQQYFYEINKVIEENNGFTLIRTWYWSCEENGKLCAWNINMYNGDIALENKRLFCNARAVCTL